MQDYVSRFYRVETTAGLGPYMGSGGVGWDAYVQGAGMGFYEAESEYHAHNRPNPAEEQESVEITRAWCSMSKYDWFLGFNTLRQLVEWFPDLDGRQNMQEAGFKLAVYEGPHIPGNYQCLFKRADAKRVGFLDLVTFEEIKGDEGTNIEPAHPSVEPKRFTVGPAFDAPRAASIRVHHSAGIPRQAFNPAGMRQGREGKRSQAPSLLQGSKRYIDGAFITRHE